MSDPGLFQKITVTSTTFASKSDADSFKTNRIACIEVPWVEGQGL